MRETHSSAMGFTHIHQVAFATHTDNNNENYLIFTFNKAIFNNLIEFIYQVMADKIQRFFLKNPVFTYDAFAEAMRLDVPRSPNTIKAMLQHHSHQGHIVRIRREFFASIPPGADSKSYPINPFLIAGQVTDDAVIAYHSALAFYQTTYSASYRFTFLTDRQIRPFQFRSENYEAIKFPKSLSQQKKQQTYVNTEDVQGLYIKVTSLERTLVDVLDKPMLGEGWEEIYRSLEMIPRLKINDIINYALLLDNATTVAKVGFYLSLRQKEWEIKPAQLKKLQQHCPVSPHYIDKQARKNGQLISDWNIIVPKSIIEQSWQEITDE